MGLLGLFFFKQKRKTIAVEEPNHSAEWPNFSGNDEKDDYRKLADSLKEKLRFRFNLSQETTVASLLAYVPDDMLRERIQLIFSSCERAAFSPLPANSIEHLLHEAKNCLEIIDNHKTQQA